MFTGLIEEIGLVKSVSPSGDGVRLVVDCDSVLDDLKVMDSIAVNGVCLTVVARSVNSFEVDLVRETLERSTLGEIGTAYRVNLERSVTPSQRLGGHIVQGHVDGTAVLRNVKTGALSTTYTFEISDDLSVYIVEKGSITLDGVSLTVAQIEGNSLDIALIPHTLEVTTFGEKKPGSLFNIEVDIIAKYVKKMMGAFSEKKSLTFEDIERMGY